MAAHLVRRARGTEWRESLGPWLYGVAFRVARKARAVRAKRLVNERQAPAMADAPTPPTDNDDSDAILDEDARAPADELQHPPEEVRAWLAVRDEYRPGGAFVHRAVVAVAGK